MPCLGRRDDLWGDMLPRFPRNGCAKSRARRKTRDWTSYGSGRTASGAAGSRRRGGARLDRAAAVGIGVLPVPLRNVALTAMETATLHRLFPGRLTVGVGHGVQDWMGQVGARPESPVTLLRSTSRRCARCCAASR